MFIKPNLINYAIKLVNKPNLMSNQVYRILIIVFLLYIIWYINRQKINNKINEFNILKMLIKEI